MISSRWKIFCVVLPVIGSIALAQVDNEQFFTRADIDTRGLAYRWRFDGLNGSVWPEDIAGLNATNYGCARSNGTSSVLFVNETSMTSAGGGGTNFASTGTITNKFTSFTICGWIYQVGNVNGFFGVSQGTNPPGAHFGINIARATNQVQVTIYNPAVGGSYDDYSAFFPTYGTNDWIPFAFSWNSNHVGTIYLGGIERTNTYSFAGTRPTFLPVQPLMFGRTSGNASRWTTNNYDDWRIYSEVLSSSRIWRIANKAERLQ